MSDVIKNPCDAGVIQGRPAIRTTPAEAGPWVLAATILGSSMVFINGSTVNVALPALQMALASTVVDIQWVVNAYTLFLASLILLGGSLGDHLGRRRIFMIGVAIFAAASLWCGLAPTVNMLIVARAVQGIGGALLTPGSLAIISATFAEEERGRTIGLWAGFSALTSALGPLLGGWLIDTFSWRWIFFLHLPLAAIVLVISWWRVPESRDEQTSAGIDWWGAVLATLGLGGITYGLIESSTRGLAHPFVLTALIAGVTLLALLVVVEARAEAPLIPPGLFRSRTFSGANALTLLLYTALGGILFFLPLNLVQVQGYSATAAGAALLPTILLLSLLSSWSGGLMNRVGARLPLIVGPAVAAAGFFLFSLPGIGGSYWTTFFPATAVLGLGMAISVAPLTATVMSAVPAHYAGTASGINNAAARVANLLAVALLGIVMLQTFSHHLNEQVAALSLPAEAQAMIIRQRADLANLQPPASLNSGQVAAVEQVVAEAFVAGFRFVAYLTAGLALFSAVIAWFTIEAGVIGEADQAQIQEFR